MTTKNVDSYEIIEYVPGINKDIVGTANKQYVSGRRIRFNNGRPEKIAGYTHVSLDNDASVSGKARTMYSGLLDSIATYVIGTHSKLYTLIGTQLTNITPLKATTVTVANSLATHYDTLANNPITTTNGSKTVTIADADSADYVVGDNITLSGIPGDVNGIPVAELNALHKIRSIGSGNYTIRVGSDATSSGAGGGASVVRTSGLITVTAASHGQANGDRVKIASAGDTGGIVAATHINREHVIRGITAGTFDIMTLGVASSSVSGGGGASTTYQAEIDDGNENEIAKFGYGSGKYGVGIYGTSRVSGSREYPRIWSFDRFGETIIGTPGGQTGLYKWDGDITAAPALVANAPTAINYAFVSDNIVVTLGADGIGNRIKGSAQNDETNWTSSSTNTVFTDDIEGAGEFISHAPSKGVNLLYTGKEVYLMRFISLPLVWDIEQLASDVGIIGRNARVVVNGIVFWMSEFNFHMWRGGSIELIPSNTGNQSSIKGYVFDDLNKAQKSKCFATYNSTKNDVEFHYPSAGSNEPDRIARVCLDDYTWSYEEDYTRTAAEYPNVTGDSRRKIGSDGTIYNHDVGWDENGVAAEWSLTSALTPVGAKIGSIVEVLPDSLQTGNITFRLTGQFAPQSPAMISDNQYTVTPETEIMPTAMNGRYYQYTWSGEALGQEWRMGAWWHGLKATDARR